jgi:hypothetical protein
MKEGGREEALGYCSQPTWAQHRFKIGKIGAGIGSRYKRV